MIAILWQNHNINQAKFKTNSFLIYQLSRNQKKMMKKWNILGKQEKWQTHFLYQILPHHNALTLNRQNQLLDKLRTNFQKIENKKKIKFHLMTGKAEFIQQQAVQKIDWTNPINQIRKKSKIKHTLQYHW